tara:strand:- start:705 stop:1196 length:492 start_codon:yes stop_codon:yes gene_type:complete
MRSFKTLLNESKKTYKFKIGIAGEIPEGFAARMETSLKKFSIVNLSSGKKTPIQERPLDFPNLQNTEVTYFEAEIEYPTTSQVLAEYLGNYCTVARGNIIVRNTNEPLDLYQQETEDKVYEPILTKEDMGGESAQDSVGGNRVMELLKELEKASKERAATQEK